MLVIIKQSFTKLKALVSVEQSPVRSGLSQCFGEQLERSCKDHLGGCSWYIQVSPVKGNGSFQHCRVSCSEITSLCSRDVSKKSQLTRFSTEQRVDQL